MTTECGQALLDEFRAREHSRCVACGSPTGAAARLRFTVRPDGGVEAWFPPSPLHQGYDGILHGGVIATLLDAAMTNCLFAHGCSGVTADLHVRFRHPVVAAQPSLVQAEIERSLPPLFVLRAELLQSGRCHATAVGKFVDRRDPMVAAQGRGFPADSADGGSRPATAT